MSVGDCEIGCLSCSFSSHGLCGPQGGFCDWCRGGGFADGWESSTPGLIVSRCGIVLFLGRGFALMFGLVAMG